MKRRLFFCLTLLTLLASTALVRAAPAVALFYGGDAPYGAVEGFGIVVLGPDPHPLMELLAELGLEPVIICESAGTQAEDACTMQRLYGEVASRKR